MPTSDATISYSSTQTSISVWLSNLQADFNGTRTAYWTLSGPSSDSQQADGLATVTFSGLKASTSYTISCSILVSPTYGTPEYYTPKNSPITVTTSASSRPDSWSWTYVGVGLNLEFPASEWNNFTTRINQFRHYKGSDDYSFTTASRGMEITASIVNEAVTAINAMNPPTLATSAVAGVTDFDAAYFNSLARALNSIT